MEGLSEFQNKVVREFCRTRQEKGLTLREAAKQTGVSASTLQRIQSGTERRLDIDLLARLTHWLGIRQIDMEAIAIEVPNTLEAICRVIRLDPKLTDDSAEVLCRIMTLVYNETVEKVNGTTTI